MTCLSWRQARSNEFMLLIGDILWLQRSPGPGN